MSSPSDRIDTLRNRIESSTDIDDVDRELLLAFDDELLVRSADYSDHRREKLLRHCTIMAEQIGGLATALYDENAAKEVVKWINRNYSNEETNRDYRVALRVFANRVTESSDLPESVDWVSSQTSKNYDPAPSPSDMLHWEEHVIPMIDATHNPRDAALIAVAWDSGARSGEVRELQVSDVTDHKHGLQITVNGKTGRRSVTLIPSVPYLRDWLRHHPGRNTPSAPLWSKLHSVDDVSYNTIKKALESAADRANITRPVTLTNFRKSSASYLASSGMSQAHLEDHHGWKRSSKAAGRYITVFGDAADNELARIHGLEVEDTTPEPKAVECPRCDKETPAQDEFCMWCGQALKKSALRTVREREREVRTALLRLAQDNPELISDAQKASDILTIVEEHPELIDDADRFIEALSSGS